MASLSNGPRASGSAVISFGLVSCPVKLYSAQSSHDIAFNQLHDTDKGRLHQGPMVCSACSEDVPKDHIVKGYEHAKNQYVSLTADELASLRQATDDSIEILEFVPLASVDAIYFEQSKHLGPDKGAAKAYRLLAEAMHAAGRAAIAKYGTRGKERLALIRTVKTEVGIGLMLHLLYYGDEVRDASAIDHGEGATISDGEKGLALTLIEQLTTDHFDAGQYSDTYRDNLMAMIDQKVAGHEVTVSVAQPPKAAIVDMMEALKASIAAKSAGKPAAAKAGKGRKAA